MLKTRITLGNISRFLRFLINLIKWLMFELFKDSSTFTNVQAGNIRILVHEVRLLLALTFVPLPYMQGWCHDIYFQLWRVYLCDVWGLILVFAFFTIAPLISESLPGKTLLLWQFSKNVWAPFYHKLAQYH